MCPVFLFQCLFSPPSVARSMVKVKLMKGVWTMRILAVLFLVHGLISGAQSFSGFSPKGGVANPAWMAWWPARLGQSWLFEQMGLTSRGAYVLTGVVWLLIMAGFLVAGVALWANPARPGWGIWAAWSAILSLVVLAVYLHPWYAGAVLLNLAILVAAVALGRVR